jgi:hypothetical protein
MNKLKKLTFIKNFLSEFKEADKSLSIYIKDLDKQINILKRYIKINNIINNEK